MASIKIDSKIVAKACDSIIKIQVNAMISEEKTIAGHRKNPRRFQTGIPHEISNSERKIMNYDVTKGKCFNLKKLAEYSPNGLISITHDDFALIGEYLPKPTAK